NAGAEQLVGSFALFNAVPDATGSDIVIDIITGYPFPSGSLPAWWMFRNDGTCRLSALSVSFEAEDTNVTCQDWGGGVQVGLIGAYRTDQPFPGRARLTISTALPADRPKSLTSGVEYYSFTLRISHVKTVGAGACGGCDVPMTVFFR